MLASSSQPSETAQISLKALMQDYFALMKPRIMALVIFTALVGMFFGTPQLDFMMASISLFAIAVGAGASAVFNMAAEGVTDGLMKRTQTRPIPAGRVSKDEAEQFGLLLSVLSVTLLGLAANWLAAGLLAFTIIFYGVYYTRYLKPRTPQNIVIGGLAGALPPLIGAAAMTGSLTLPGWVLLAVIFMWTPPHFWALALISRHDYEKAGIPMLPNTDGLDVTLRQMKIYGWLCLVVTALPLVLGFASFIYCAAFVVMNVIFMRSIYHITFDASELGLDRKIAIRCFFVSILYLFVLFAALLIERLLGMAPLLEGIG